MFNILKKKSSDHPSTGFFSRLKQGLSKTRNQLSEGFSNLLLGKKALDTEILEQKEMITLLNPCEKKLIIAEDKKPFVILMVGVNGSGKTTTIGKLAHYWQSQGHQLLLAAGDTFRAAAVEQ